MGVPRRVPWYTNLEWLDVYNALFDTSSNISHKRVALSRVGLYEFAAVMQWCVLISIDCRLGITFFGCSCSCARDAILA